MQMARALVAAGERDWQFIFSEALEQQGYHVDIAGRFADADELIRQFRYEVVIADESLLPVNQANLVLTIRDLSPVVPVVLVTGDDTRMFAEIWRRCGVTFVGSRLAAMRRIPEVDGLVEGEVRTAASAGVGVS